MNIILGLVFVFFAYTYFKDAMNPDRLSRMRVQAMCATMGALALLVAALLIFSGMSGA